MIHTPGEYLVESEGGLTDNLSGKWILRIKRSFEIDT